MNWHIVCCGFFLGSTVQAQQVLPLEQGATLGAVNVGGSIHTIAVVADNRDHVRGVDLSQYSDFMAGPVDFYQRFGVQKIVEMTRAAVQEQTSRKIEYQQLLSPAGDTTHHIALGFNYSAHADEIGEEEQPFPFIKYVQGTRNTQLEFDESALLDYEVEMCARPLHVIDSDNVENSAFGYFLCGDFTDRALLMRNLNLDDMASGQGFSLAKSHQGYFPVGPYMIIPLAGESFVDDIGISLTLNGRQRQSAKVEQRIWNTHTSVEQILQADQTERPTYSPYSQRWLPEEVLTPSHTLLTGTPDGVLMQPPGLWHKVRFGMSYFLSGGIFRSDSDIRSYVIERYIESCKRHQVFLQPGDQVTLSGDWLGEIQLVVR